MMSYLLVELLFNCLKKRSSWKNSIKKCAVTSVYVVNIRKISKYLVSVEYINIQKLSSLLGSTADGPSAPATLTPSMAPFQKQDKPIDFSSPRSPNLDPTSLWFFQLHH